jgi:hypothetical protein
VQNVIEQMQQRNVWTRSQPDPLSEFVCSCGITFEPLPWHDEDLTEPLCDECADAA